MKRFGKKRERGEYNFWQPATDMMTGLVFILLLLVALLGLFLVYTPEQEAETAAETQETGRDDEEGDSYGEYETEPETEAETWEDHDDGGGDDDGGGGDGIGPGWGEEEGIKSAVLVELVDEETQRIVRTEGVRFELYEANGALQILNTYYPEKISYREFATTEEGIFYLPEKIYQGSYYFRELTEPEGYDRAEDYYFDLWDLYDWPEPYIVRIPVSPSKNVIRIQMEDAQNGQSVAGAVFQIIAAEDIVTMDGTLRFHEGETAGEINCNEQGYGESEPLYLGTYLLRQSGIPEYYAKIQEEPEAEVEKRGNEETETLEVLAERTRIRLKLTDELYDTLPLEGAQFSVSQEGKDELELLYTDRNGILELSSLDKNAVYHIRQTEAGEGYLLPGEEYTVTVDQDGRIDGEAEAELNLTNRIIRVNIQAAEAVLQRGLTDVPMALYDADGTLIHSWRANGTGESVTGLNPGTYRITLGEAGDKSYEFQVRDVCEIQNWRISVFTWQSGAVLAAAAGCVAAVVVAVVAKSRKKRSEKSDE